MVKKGSLAACTEEVWPQVIKAHLAPGVSEFPRSNRACSCGRFKGGSIPVQVLLNVIEGGAVLTSMSFSDKK